MSIIANEGEKRAVHLPPQENLQAVCFDVWDLGMQTSEFKGERKVQHKIKIGFELEARIESQDDFNGKRYRIYKDYTLSLGPKANLRKDLTAWRGRAFTEEELAGFDVETLVGANCLLNIIHYEGQDKKPRAKISAISSLPKGMAKIEPEQKREIPEWVQRIINEALTAPAATPEAVEGIPF